MRYEQLPEDLLQLVTPPQARSYLLAKGWQRVPGVNGTIAVFARPDSDEEQVIVPMEPAFDDYARRVADVVLELAEYEKRPTGQILQDLLAPDADVVRYSVSGPGAEAGSLPLPQASRFLEGAKRSLLAAACSVIRPSAYHPRMTRSEATQLLDACRLGQTERGSFTIAISCPLRAIEDEQDDTPDAEPFVRRVVSLLMRSAQRLVSAIEADNVPAVLGEGRDQEPVLSANFCDALLRMQPPEERSMLSLSVSWASTLSAREAAVPRRVTFRSEYFPIIEDIYKKLRPAHEPVAALFVGQVDALNGNVGEDGRVQGEASLLVLHDDELVRVRVDLNADDYQKAVEAHRTAGLVKCRGVIHLGRRTHRLTNVSEFELLQQ